MARGGAQAARLLILRASNAQHITHAERTQWHTTHSRRTLLGKHGEVSRVLRESVCAAPPRRIACMRMVPRS